MRQRLLLQQTRRIPYLASFNPGENLRLATQVTMTMLEGLMCDEVDGVGQTRVLYELDPFARVVLVSQDQLRMPVMPLVATRWLILASASRPLPTWRLGQLAGEALALQAPPRLSAAIFPEKTLETNFVSCRIPTSLRLWDQHALARPAILALRAWDAVLWEVVTLVIAFVF